MAEGSATVSTAGNHAVASGTALGSQAGTPFHFAGFLVVFPATHLFLDSTALDQFSEAAYGLLDGLTFPQRQLNH
jgi:hypothetical protein